MPLVAIALFVALLCGSTARADTIAQAAPIAPANFGSPPSGEIPILYNDHTVYATPDILKQARVLAALVKDGQIYIPLRSMLEQMGATVSVSSDGNTISAVKSGASVSVTVGSSQVVINGETRPLDVPPMLYHGIVLAPVRVLSEAMGAYVLWVPERRLVVVRYIPATPPPIATPTPEPVVAPLPTPSPTPEYVYPGFIAAAITAPKTYNEFSAGQYCPRSYLISGAYAFRNSPFAVKVDYRQDSYVTSDNITDFNGNHFTRFATIDGGVAFTPVFLAKQSNLDGRLEYKIASPQIYVGVGYLYTSTNYGYPHLSGFGAGLEKLPDLRPGIRIFGSAFYYPTASGDYTIADPLSPNATKTYRQQYHITKYDIGLSLVLGHSPLYLYGGFAGDSYQVKQNAPIGQTHSGPYVGLGVTL